MDRWRDTWGKGRKTGPHWVIENLDPQRGDGKGLTGSLVCSPVPLTALLQLRPAEVKRLAPDPSAPFMKNIWEPDP